MPLHLNLLHENQEEEAQRRRDPVKIGAMALALIGLLLGLFYLQQSAALGSLVKNQRALEAEWKSLEPQELEAATEQVRLEELIRSSKALVDFSAERFLAAPSLGAIVKRVPPTIQIRSLTFSINPANRGYAGSMGGLAVAGDPRAHADEFRVGFTRLLEENFHSASVAITSLDDSSLPVTLDDESLSAAVFDFSFNGLLVEPPELPEPIPSQRRR